MIAGVVVLALLAGVQSQAPSQPPPNQIAPQRSEATGDKDAAEQDTNAAANWWVVGLTGALVVLTGALVWVGWKQRQTYEATLAANKVVERAYVDMSHRQPGVTINPVPTDAGHAAAVEITVKNYGRTPADVTSVVLALLVSDQLPDVPPYRPSTGEGTAFLMPGEQFLVTPNLLLVPTDAFAKIEDGKATLWVLGYVDYFDRFKRKHRGGYARRYVPKQPAGKNNLVFVTKPGYNYDIDLN